MPCVQSTAAIDKPPMLGHGRGMSSTVTGSAGTLLKQGSFLFFLLSRSLSRFSSQIAGVAIGWQSMI